jgi:hypothetical protein
VGSIKAVSKLPFYTIESKKQEVAKEHAFKSLLAIKLGTLELQKVPNELEEKNIIDLVRSQSFLASTEAGIAVTKPTSFSMPVNVGDIVQVIEEDLDINLRLSLSLLDNDIAPVTLDLELSATEKWTHRAYLFLVARVLIQTEL